MIKVGIIGGIGPESTLDYYKSIITAYRKITGDENYPKILINSINMTEMLSYVSDENYDQLINLLLNSVRELKDGGADFAVIASNTPHIVFEKIEKQTPIPLISIVDETAKKASFLQLKNVLLIGTAFTMKSSFYTDGFRNYNIPIQIPSSEEQEIIHGIIFPDLEEGIVRPEKKIQMLELCNNIIMNKKCDGIVLGCTELPLMLTAEDFAVSVLNTTQIHIDSIVRKFVRDYKRGVS